MASLLFAGIAATAALLLEGGSQETGAKNVSTVHQDTEFGNLFGEGPDFAELHRQVRTELRDDEWARRIEAVLNQHYAAVPGVGGTAGRLRVICAATLCEVAGELGQAEIEVAMQAIQGAELADALASEGLENITNKFSSNGDKRALFAAYWTRAEE